jgi:hypothetical protein
MLRRVDVMAENHDQGKNDSQSRTTWSKANDAGQRIEIIDPNKGPKRKRK